MAPGLPISIHHNRSLALVHRKCSPHLGLDQRWGAPAGPGSCGLQCRIPAHTPAGQPTRRARRPYCAGGQAAPAPGGAAEPNRISATPGGEQQRVQQPPPQQQQQPQPAGSGGWGGFWGRLQARIAKLGLGAVLAYGKMHL